MGLGTSLTKVGGRRVPAIVMALGLLAGCAGTPGPDGINDPYEPTNRAVHNFNRGLDRALVGPAAKGYGSVVPEPAQEVVGNVADTLGLPGDIVNNLLQGRVIYAAENTLRLGVNLTAGVAGIFDVSSALGLRGKPSDFGETLHVWGVGEGVYLELPVLGPSTARDTTGAVVDLLIDPVRQILPPDGATAASAISIFSRLGDRARFSETVESILYESADSYAQARLLYLQNRRFELGQADGSGAGGAEDEGFIDPYEDPYAE